MLYFKLDNIKNDEDLIKIISKIKYSLSQIPNIQDKIMVVRFENITNDDSTIIPKLEHKKI